MAINQQKCTMRPIYSQESISTDHRYSKTMIRKHLSLHLVHERMGVKMPANRLKGRQIKSLDSDSEKLMAKNSKSQYQISQDRGFSESLSCYHQYHQHRHHHLRCLKCNFHSRHPHYQLAHNCRCYFPLKVTLWTRKVSSSWSRTLLQEIFLSRLHAAS